MASPQPARFVPGPRRGDQRRESLLRGLETLLAERRLSEIGIADISRAAGAKRSAFYFYFPSKGAAVAVLLSAIYDDLETGATGWYDGGEGTALERIRGGFDASITVWREHSALFVAMFDAIGADDAEARQIWADWIDRMVVRITKRIQDEQSAGLARQTLDPPRIATILTGAVLSVIERDVRAITAGERPLDALITAMIETWHTVIYPDTAATHGGEQERKPTEKSPQEMPHSPR